MRAPDVWPELIPRADKIPLITYGGHEHLYYAILEDLRRIGELGEHGTRIVVNHHKQRNDSSFTEYAFDPSFHSVMLNQEEWTRQGEYLERAKGQFPGRVDAERRRLSGPLGPLTLMRLIGEYARRIGPAIDCAIDAWLQTTRENGFAVVRDPMLPLGILEQARLERSTLRSALDGFGIVAQELALLPRIRQEEAFQRIHVARAAGYKVWMKLFADGSFGATTVDTLYETETSLRVAREGLENGLDGIIIHAIGAGAVEGGLEWVRSYSRAFPKRSYELHHLEVVPSRLLSQIKDACEEIEDLRLCLQPNFYYPDATAYATHPAFSDPAQILPLDAMLKAVGKERILLGTDGLPPQIGYLLTSALSRAEPEARLDIGELIPLLYSAEASETAPPVLLDLDAFARGLDDFETRTDILAHPYGHAALALNTALVRTQVE